MLLYIGYIRYVITLKAKNISKIILKKINITT